jgi:hypothetical protein
MRDRPFLIRQFLPVSNFPHGPVSRIGLAPVCRTAMTDDVRSSD